MDGSLGCAYTGAANTGYTTLPNLRIVYTPNGTLTGTVTSCSGGAPLAGVLVTCGTATGTTNAAGVYTMSVSPGNYIANYTVANFQPGSAAVTITSAVTTTKNICLNPNPAVLAGIVTSAATGNPIIGATITVGPFSGISTGPVSYTHLTLPTNREV